jgi:translation initiation factor IF-1
VRLDEGQDVTAHPVMGPKKSFVRLVVGDRVVVELTANDSGRGRIVKRVS